MSYPTGSIRVTGPIGRTHVDDKYATHFANLSKGGHHHYATIADLNAVDVLVRDWGMFATIYADPTPANNKTYRLSNIALGGASNTITDNSNWIEFNSGNGSSTVASRQSFTANGILTTFTVSVGTLDQINFVDVNGIIQDLGVDYTVSGQDVTFAVAVPNGKKITVHFYDGLVISDGITDGDKGDIVVTSSGSIWSIDNGAVTFAKIQSLNPSTLIGNSSESFGVSHEIVVSNAIQLSTGTLKFGGLLANNTTMYFNGYSFEIGAGATASRLANHGMIDDDTIGLFAKTYTSSSESDAIWISNSGMGFQHYTSSILSKITKKDSNAAGFDIESKNASDVGMKISISNTALTITDTRTTKTGMQYAATGYVTTDRSLTDKGYVDTKLIGKNLPSAPSGGQNGQALRWNEVGQIWQYYTPADLIDGDKGDITVSSSGTVWSIDVNAVSLNKIVQISAYTLLGRPSNVAGDVQEVNASNGLYFDSTSLKVGGTLTGDIEFNGAYSIRFGNSTPIVDYTIDTESNTGSIVLISNKDGYAYGFRSGLLSVDKFQFIDNRLGASKRGLEYESDITTLVGLSLTHKIYVDSHLGGKNVSSVLTSPTSGNEKNAVIWDSSSNNYTLFDFVSAQIVSASGTITLNNNLNGYIIICSNAAGTTVTIPTGLINGFNCTIYRTGSGGPVTLSSAGTLESVGTVLNTPKTACTILHTSGNNHIAFGAF